MGRTLWLRVITIAVITVVAIMLVFPVDKSINYGLDLKGGVHIVMRGIPSPGAPVNDKAMNGAKEVIENRINGLGVKEPTVQREGKDRLIVELPEVKDPEEAIRTIGRTALLEFKDPQGKTVLTGQDLKDAGAEYTNMNQPVVTLEFNNAGAKKFADMTTKYVGQVAPILLDGQPISMPKINEPITDGRAQIEGSADLKEAENLAMLLRSGALPVKLEVAESRTVGPSLGQSSIDKSMRAGLIGSIAVVVFMFIFYLSPGLLADLALCIYALITVGALAAIHAVLTLPGIAGIILSIGMAVDANVIIFERVRDELRAGRTLRAAIDAGFKNAMRAIIDSNVTTLIATVVLFYLGTGPIRGFAVTLSIGIIASMFTAIFVTRTFLQLATKFNILKSSRAFGIKEGEVA